ncbi:hypothetical protein Tco_1004252 [Tanacetum coccineum]|uniref:Uncharacterized protein n=1 Tax=Tanacetum coccineum TaxID=301880 RepID=A0ABQ5FBZ7_9ASTR
MGLINSVVCKIARKDSRKRKDLQEKARNSKANSKGDSLGDQKAESSSKLASRRRATPLQMVCDMRRMHQQVLYDGKAGDARCLWRNVLARVEINGQKRLFNVPNGVLICLLLWGCTSATIFASLRLLPALTSASVFVLIYGDG